jgi:hypothetical protein
MIVRTWSALGCWTPNIEHAKTARFQMPCQEMHVAARLQAYVAPNTEVLQEGSTATLHAQDQARDVV